MRLQRYMMMINMKLEREEERGRTKTKTETETNTKKQIQKTNTNTRDKQTNTVIQWPESAAASGYGGRVQTIKHGSIQECTMHTCTIGCFRREKEYKG